jgi:hypothetical protein
MLMLPRQTTHCPNCEKLSENIDEYNTIMKRLGGGAREKNIENNTSTYIFMRYITSVGAGRSEEHEKS